jgi:signal transduction histidine kinase
MGDAVQLQQVLVNLVTNAAEAMSENRDRPRLVTIRSGIDAAGAVLVTVDDTGSGLAPQEIDRIFDSFYTTKPEGIGVGLSISRSIIEAHGGQLSASSDLPYGARFSFVLPSVKVCPEEDSGAVSGIVQPARELAGSAER